MKIWAKDTNPWLALGAALYWASYAFRIMNPEPAYAAPIGGFANVIEDVFMILWVFVTFLVCRRRGLRPTRRAMSAAMVGAAGAVLVCEAARLSLPLPAALALLGLDLFTLGCSMILWGLAFASLEKHLAARNVVVAVLMAAALILAGMALSGAVPVAWMMCLTSAGGSLIMLSGRVSLRDHRRQPLPRPGRALAVLAAQRLAYGFSLGFFPAATAALARPGFNGVLLAVALAVVAATAVAALRSDEPPCTMLPALVIVACGTLLVPFLGFEMACMFPSLFCAVWLSWQTLSSVQLSDLKVRYGFSELEITFADKMAIAVTILAGTVSCDLVEAFAGIATLPLGTVETLLPVAFCGLTVTASFCLGELVSVHQEDAIRGRIAQESAEYENLLLAEVAGEFCLSAREHEVFALLAQGHTNAFIAESTGITHGTAKAHAAHIYKKLGVHSKDEMLELVERRAARG